MRRPLLTSLRASPPLAGDQGCRGYGMRKGERYRKSVRGCIVSHQTSVLHLVVVKKGDAEIEHEGGTEYVSTSKRKRIWNS